MNNQKTVQEGLSKRSLIEKLDRVPPYLCRLMATTRWGRKGLSHDELAHRSGLTKSTISRLSRLTTWRNITLDTVQRFADACGVDLLRTKTTLRPLRMSRMVFFKNSNAEQRRFYIRIMRTAQTVTMSKDGSGDVASGDAEDSSARSSREAMKIG